MFLRLSARLGPCLSALSCVSQAKGGEQVKKGYVGIHSSGFKDFLLKPELLRVRFSSCCCCCLDVDCLTLSAV